MSKPTIADVAQTLMEQGLYVRIGNGYIEAGQEDLPDLCMGYMYVRYIVTPLGNRLAIRTAVTRSYMGFDTREGDDHWTLQGIAEAVQVAKGV